MISFSSVSSLQFIADRGRTLIPALESVYQWADEQMKEEK